MKLRWALPALVAATTLAAIGMAAAGADTTSQSASSPALYVVPNNPAAQAAKTHPAVAAELNQIAGKPTALWITEQSPLNLLNSYQTDATGKRQVPVYVLYAIPKRDCGSYSAGGFKTATEYRAWVDKIKVGIAGRSAAFIIEPDALPKLDICGFTPAQKQERTALIRYAVETLTAPGVFVYVEGGGAYSNPVSVIAPRLQAAGVAKAAGFALNIAAFDTTQKEIAYGHQLSDALGGKHFVIDTSRNGVGVPPGTPNGAFCKVKGLALGARPTTRTGDPRVDAFLWVKYPGESDGDCGNGAPRSGVFWVDYAVELFRNS